MNNVLKPGVAIKDGNYDVVLTDHMKQKLEKWCSETEEKNAAANDNTKVERTSSIGKTKIEGKSQDHKKENTSENNNVIKERKLSSRVSTNIELGRVNFHPSNKDITRKGENIETFPKMKKEKVGSPVQERKISKQRSFSRINKSYSVDSLSSRSPDVLRRTKEKTPDAPERQDFASAVGGKREINKGLTIDAPEDRTRKTMSYAGYSAHTEPEIGKRGRMMKMIPTRFTDLATLLGKRFQNGMVIVDNLRKIGILKNPKVFGSTLTDISKAEKIEVPKFLTKCMSMIENKPGYMNTNGLYRQNGNLAIIQGHRFDVDSGQLEKLDDVKNVHILTGLIKLFFRELREPLIPMTIIEKMMNLLKVGEKVEDDSVQPSIGQCCHQINKGDTDKIKQMVKIINGMQNANRETLWEVLSHLALVKKNEKENMMNSHNLSIVMGPTFSWSQEASNLENMATFMQKQNTVVQMLIDNFNQIEEQRNKN